MVLLDPASLQMDCYWRSPLDGVIGMLQHGSLGQECRPPTVLEVVPLALGSHTRTLAVTFCSGWTELLSDNPGVPLLPLECTALI